MDIERARALTVEDFHRRAAALRPRALRASWKLPDGRLDGRDGHQAA